MKALLKKAMDKGYEPRLHYLDRNLSPYDKDKGWQFSRRYDRQTAEYLELCLMQKWLRERGTHVTVVVLDDNFGLIIDSPESFVIIKETPENYTVYEAALKAGIKRGLELI